MMTKNYDSIQYCTVAVRLETFKNWPFHDNCSCNALKMAEAGFFQPNPEGEPDLAKCFICMKELNGWEETDEPMEEHKKHQNTCEFMKLDKKESDITVADLLELLQASILREVKVNYEKELQNMEKGKEVLIQELAQKWKKKK